MLYSTSLTEVKNKMRTRVNFFGNAAHPLIDACCLWKNGMNPVRL